MKLPVKKYLILTLCFVLSLCCGCSEKTEKTGGIKETKKQEKDKIIRIACIGDSLTQGIGASGWQDGISTFAYPQQLQEILGNKYKVGNFGKGSSFVYYYEGRTESLWYPNTAQYSLSNQFDPDIVIILLGTNDARVMDNLADANAFKYELTALVEHYLDLETKPEVYVLNSITLERYDRTKEQQLKKYIIPMQEEVARELGCKFIDLYNGLYDYFITGEGFASDSLHPNDAGYRKIAEYIAENLDL